jgi:hypothetical protein
MVPRGGGRDIEVEAVAFAFKFKDLPREGSAVWKILFCAKGAAHNALSRCDLSAYGCRTGGTGEFIHPEGHCLSSKGHCCGAAKNTLI